MKPNIYTPVNYTTKKSWTYNSHTCVWLCSEEKRENHLKSQAIKEQVEKKTNKTKHNIDEKM